MSQKKTEKKITTRTPANAEAVALWPLVDQQPRHLMLGDVAQMIKFWKWSKVESVLKKCTQAGWVLKVGRDKEFGNEYQITKAGLIAFKHWQGASLDGIMLILALALAD